MLPFRRSFSLTSLSKKGQQDTSLTCQHAVLDVRHQRQVALGIVKHRRAHLALQRERHLGVGPDGRVQGVGERVEHELGVREGAVARQRVEDQAVAPPAEAQPVVQVRRDRDRQALFDRVLEAGRHPGAEDVDASGVGGGARGLVVGVLVVGWLVWVGWLVGWLVVERKRRGGEEKRRRMR